MHVCGISEQVADEVARHMTPGFVAAARRLVLLRRLEWEGLTGRGTEESPFRACCPECRNDREQGHADGCELGAEVARR